ncbi:MAG: hypothetical protein CVV44_07490 [Spirochaetae bacterium HGW-Spirochaetae-1]|nr:MAG: hypothetical protein CVV44_07490 [Spirochaetae bacterium HGW-Spirochaetae-1]
MRQQSYSRWGLLFLPFLWIFLMRPVIAKNEMCSRRGRMYKTDKGTSDACLTTVKNTEKGEL